MILLAVVAFLFALIGAGFIVRRLRGHFHKARQGQLRNGCAVAVQQSARCGHGCHQRRRQNHIADAQARKHGFGERADVDGALVRIKPLHAGDGLAGIVEFAVVIVFDDPFFLMFRAWFWVIVFLFV